VSDRRWVKVAALLKMAAASEGRAEVALWDLWLLPWCVAPDIERQNALDAWLASRLGLEAGMSPPLLTRVVEAFEAQAQLEAQAEDLDYDESGRLKFSAELEAQVTDAKGAAQAMRMSYRKQRRYGATHIAARVRQIDELIGRIGRYADTIASRRDELAAYAARSLWLDPDFAARAQANLAKTAAGIESLRQRAAAARGAFEALPRLASDPGVTPDPVPHEPLAA
jgi:MoxR-like ATPase